MTTQDSLTQTIAFLRRTRTSMTKTVPARETAEERAARDEVVQAIDDSIQAIQHTVQCLDTLKDSYDALRRVSIDTHARAPWDPALVGFKNRGGAL